MAIVFWILAGVDVIAAAIIVFFLVVGLVDGSVSSYNASVWILIVSWPAVAIGGGFLLRSRGRTGLAALALMVLAGPALLYGLFVLFFLVLQPDFR